MSDFTRRSFLGTSLTGLTSGCLLASDQTTDAKKASEATKPAESAKAADATKPAEVKKASDIPAFQPNTLFLTWQRDPTTTMTVQWIGVSGETADTSIHFVKLAEETNAAAWQTQK